MGITFVSLFFQGASLGVTAAASPGLFQTFLITQTLGGGWRRGLPVAFSPFLSDPPIVITILFLLNKLPASFLNWISLAGGLFAMYLAWITWQGWKKTSVGNEKDPETSPEATLQASSRQILWRGALMNLLSSGPYTFWSLVLGPLLLAAWRQSALDGFAFLLGFYTFFVGGLIVLVALFHQARRLGPRVVRSLTLLSVLILAIFAAFLIVRAFL